MPSKLSIDIETYASADLKFTGVYKYAESPDFEILLFAYAFDGDDAQVVGIKRGESLPDDVYDALVFSEDIELHAYNAPFERVCINKHFGFDIPPERWHCTMVRASMAGLPLGLDNVSKALDAKAQKNTEGGSLIRYFCKPCKPTKANGQRTRNLPEHDLEKWQAFTEYCRQDVVVERVVYDRVKSYKITPFERVLWCLDQRINERGVQLDLQLIYSAIRIDREYRERRQAEAIAISGLDNPGSVKQLTEWLEAETGNSITTLRKDDVKDLLAGDNPEHVDQMLRIRQELSKTSVKKYHSMLKGVLLDGRFRGVFQYYGANRTGRWAARLVQVHNLPQNKISGLDLDFARELVRDGDAANFEMLYGNVPDTLSQLIRTAFIAKPGHLLRVCDASAIEARIIAWLANEKWRLDVFADHGKIYEASAAQMFKVPIDTIDKESPLRAKGKISELALGYGGGGRALEAMGALNMGLEYDELQPLVTAWRGANKAIVKFWANVQRCAIDAVRTGEVQHLYPNLTFYCKGGALYIKLPSGRALSYWKPSLRPGKYGGDELVYMGLNDRKQWAQESTYGGKLVENITQAVARDCLAVAMVRVAAAGNDIVMHVHDEVVLEVPEDEGALSEIEELMSQPIEWAPGLPLAAKGFESFYYKK